MIYRVFLFLMLPFALYGQVSEDFSDGEIDNAPPWVGQKKSFTINNGGQLQLNESGSGSAYLSTLSHVNNQATWQFEIEMAFNPSAQNFSKIYLFSDLHDLSAALNGYYVKIGGPQDEISLYRQDQSDHFEIIDGTDGTTDTSSLKLAIRVTRDAAGRWELFQKPVHLDTFQTVGSAIDTAHQRAHFFGLLCQYTATRSKGFFLDNIQVDGLKFTDIEPPALQALKILDSQNIELSFGEPILTPKLFQFIIEGQGPPVRLEHKGYGRWQLEFPFSFENGIAYTLELQGIEDLFGNSIDFIQKFRFWEVGPAYQHALVISEIMADPSPALQLPEMEYLEIFNPGDKAINLLNWTLSDATSKALLPELLVAPGDFLVLAPETAIALLQPQVFGEQVNILALKSWPSLNNSGDLVTLADSTGRVIHFVDYSDNWYRNNLKQHGGWSLEIIDVRFPCSGSPNWTASIAASGGTPGKPNSVATDNPDLTPPRIINTFAESPFWITVLFDQPLSPVTGSSAKILLEPERQVDTFYVESAEEPRLTIKLKDSLHSRAIYQITAVGFADCNQNVDYQGGSSSKVGIPQTADSGDLVINEILFNPRPLGERFVELYNRSNKAVNLKSWRFGRWQGQTLTDFTYLSEANRMIYPGDYLVFTENASKLQAQYPRAISILEVNQLPSFGEKQGTLVLLAPGGYPVDAIQYHQQMHHKLLIDQNGVSLERANPNLASDDVNNWFSGSEQVGYATPGYRNSQYFVAASGETFSVEPKVITPASSRFPNYAKISFTLESSGNSGSLLIFNRQGHLVKTLVNNSLLPVNGTYQWDGSDDKARRVPLGHYIVQLQLYGQHLDTKKWQEIVAVVPDF